VRILPLNLCLLMLGCTVTSNTAARPTAPDAPPESATSKDAAQAPLLVRWQIQSDTGGHLRVLAVVSRKATLRVPIDVRVEVPAGLHLVSGETAFQLKANLEPGETIATLEFSYTTPPDGELRLIAHASGPGMGVQATDAYRFGRPQQTKPLPQATGPTHKIGTVDLGPSVPLDNK